MRWMILCLVQIDIFERAEILTCCWNKISRTVEISTDTYDVLQSKQLGFRVCSRQRKAYLEYQRHELPELLLWKLDRHFRAGCWRTCLSQSHATQRAIGFISNVLKASGELVGTFLGCYVLQMRLRHVVDSYQKLAKAWGSSRITSTDPERSSQWYSRGQWPSHWRCLQKVQSGLSLRLPITFLSTVRLEAKD